MNEETKMINNLKEFFESRGFALEDNTMWYWARALYKASFGAWISYEIEEEKAKTISYEINITDDDEGHLLPVYSEGLPADVIQFFALDDGGCKTYALGQYYDLLTAFEGEKNFSVSRTFDPDNDVINIVGTYEIEAKYRRVNYQEDEASDDTLKLADKCVGVHCGSIIEGADYDCTPFYLDFHFTEAEWDRNYACLGAELDYHWKLNNSQYFSVIDRKSGDRVIWIQWTCGANNPEGDWDKEDKEMLTLAIAAFDALWTWQKVGPVYQEGIGWYSTCSMPDNIYIPGYADYRVQEEEMPTPCFV